MAEQHRTFDAVCRRHTLTVVCCVVCQVSEWQTSSECSLPCGGGTLSQSRSIVMDGNDNLPCPDLQRGATCNTQPCRPCHNTTEYSRGVCSCAGPALALQSNDVCSCANPSVYGPYCNNTCLSCVGGLGSSNSQNPGCSLGPNGFGCRCNSGQVQLSRGNASENTCVFPEFFSAPAPVRLLYRTTLFRFRLDFNTIVIANFTASFKSEVAQLTGVLPSRIVINDIRSGSVIVNATMPADAVNKINNMTAANTTGYAIFSQMMRAADEDATSSSTAAAPASSSTAEQSSSTGVPSTAGSRSSDGRDSSSSGISDSSSSSSSGAEEDSSSSAEQSSLSAAAHAPSSSSSSSSTGVLSSSAAAHRSSSSSSSSSSSTGLRSSSATSRTSSSSSTGHDPTLGVVVEESGNAPLDTATVGIILGVSGGALAAIAAGAIVTTKYCNAKKRKLREIKKHERHHHHKSKKPLTAETPLKRHAVAIYTDHEADDVVPSADLTHLPLLR
jgi:hypothetical protein